MADGRHLETSKNVVLMDIINSLLKTGNKTTNINVKTAGNVNHTNVDISGYVIVVNIAFLWFLRFSIRRR